MSKRAFVDEQPRFRHAHGNYAYRGLWSPSTLPQSRIDLRPTILEGSPFSVPMDEEQIAGIEGNAPFDAVCKRSRRISQTPQVSKCGLDRQRTAEVPQQPRENRYQGAIRRTVGHQRVAQSLHRRRLLREQQKSHVFPIDYSFLDGRLRRRLGQHWIQIRQEVAACCVLTVLRSPSI